MTNMPALLPIAGQWLNNLSLKFGFLESTRFWVIFFWVIWLHRYVRLLVHCVSHWCYKSYPLPEKPMLTSQDVTVIVPTIHNKFEELRPSLQSILNTNPYSLMLVTTTAKLEELQKLAKTLDHNNVQVLATPIANKRLQVCEALPQVKTEIIVMADDDVTWPRMTLNWLLAPFDYDERIGGVGTCQRVRRLEPRTGTLSERCWNWLGAAYIERRNFEISATHNIDGGTSCMSGRTGAYRREILTSSDFLTGFKQERWGPYVLNADDDNFVTRWLVSHQWKTWIQYEDECQIETTLENNSKFIYQCSRWARSNWRSNWTSLVRERHVITQQPWSTYALHIATFTSLAFVVDPLLVYSCWRATQDWDEQSRHRVVWAQLIFMFAFTKVVKLVGLFRRDYWSTMFLPVSIVFGYVHGLIKLHALFTLKMTSWGSRADGDAHDSARLKPTTVPSETLITDKGASLVRWRNQHAPAAMSEKVKHTSSISPLISGCFRTARE